MSYTYGAQASNCPEGALGKAHAVVTAGTNTYCYDQNGSMRRHKIGTTTTYTFAYDAENHLMGVSGDISATFVYDRDGKRVKATIGGVATTYIGDYFEWTGSTGTMIKYFYANGQRVAMKKGSTVYFLFADHPSTGLASQAMLRTGRINAPANLIRNL